MKFKQYLNEMDNDVEATKKGDKVIITFVSAKAKRATSVLRKGQELSRDMFNQMMDRYNLVSPLTESKKY